MQEKTMNPKIQNSQLFSLKVNFILDYSYFYMKHISTNIPIHQLPRYLISTNAHVHVYAHISFIMDRMVKLQLFDPISCSKVTGWMILVQTSARDFSMLFFEKRKYNRTHYDDNRCTIKCTPFANNNAFSNCFFSFSFHFRMLF